MCLNYDPTQISCVSENVCAEDATESYLHCVGKFNEINVKNNIKTFMYSYSYNCESFTFLSMN